MAGGYSDGAKEPIASMDEVAGGDDGDDPAKGKTETENVDDLPEMTDLIDKAEEAGVDSAELASVIRNIGRRIRVTPGDRDLLTDFDGISNICTALKDAAESQHEWRGEAMLAFCKIMPDVCRTSSINRGSLRDEGFLAAVVELLRWAITESDEAAALAACIALSATCTANDGNKQEAAQLAESTPEKPGGILLCLNALGAFHSEALQTEALSALRTLMVDDDSRKADCEPAARQNAEVALSDGGFPFLGIAVERALEVADASEAPQMKLREQVLLLLREMARRQEFVTNLAFDAKLLPKVLAALKLDDPRVVRASLSVLRAFCAVEEVRDELGMLSDGAFQCLVAVQKHVGTPVVCEQGFGLMMNLTMRKGPLSAQLNEGDNGIVALGQQVLRQHGTRPDVVRSVVATMRNVASQDDKAKAEVKESDIFELVRKVVQAHEGEGRWNAAIDVSRQFLREFRADAGMEKKAQYNAYY